jgi:hypothetical protein
VFVTFIACQSTQYTDPVTPHPTPVPVDIEYCNLAEDHLIALHCSEGNPTTKGKRFGDVCRELQNAGIVVNPKCLATVKSCTEIDVCTGSR